MKLKEYREKRELGRTPEPGPALPSGAKGQYPVFVVHKHAARRLHYDLRLETGGVLKSFAVPKGPSMDPSVKRLAVMVEDHPYDYKDFEGIIPEGNYGAGGVIIWDRGVYAAPPARDKAEGEKLLREGLEKGNFKFVLAGEKLRGEFALVRTKWDEKSWLLLKKKDEYASAADVLKDGRSVVSGKTLEELGAAKTPARRAERARSGKVQAAVLENAPAGEMPRKVEPMLPSAVKKPFDHPDWLFEVKWDGYRAIAELRKERVLLYSRARLSLAERFPPVVEELRKAGLEAVLDGEVVALDKAGLPDFQLLQDYRKSRRGRLVYYVFDLLYCGGRDLTGLPLRERKELLKKVLPSSAHVKFSDHVWRDGIKFFDAARKKGLEGIVAKYSLGAYRPGARSGNWLKIKNRLTQDLVIAGFTAPRGARKYLGSLVLGAYEKGELVYAGHSGGSFGGEKVKELYEKLLPLVRKERPFKTSPPDAAVVTWVRPELVCETAFTGWTRDGLLRQPVFLRLREDKSAREAVLERPEDFAGEEKT